MPLLFYDKGTQTTVSWDDKGTPRVSSFAQNTTFSHPRTRATYRNVKHQSRHTTHAVRILFVFLSADLSIDNTTTQLAKELEQ